MTKAPLRNPDGTFTPTGARAAGKKGGANFTDLKRFSLSMARRKWCTTGCQVYERCPAMVVAQGRTPDAKGRVPCVLKEQSIAIRTQIARTFFQGREGLVDQIMTVLYRHSAAVEARQVRRVGDDLGEDPYLYAQDARLLMDLYKLLYGEKRSVDLTGGLDVAPDLPDDPDLYREIGDLLAARMNKPDREESS